MVESMNRAIVTGANGFIGSELCKTLSNNGVDVIAVVKDKTSDLSRLENLKNIEIVYCSLDSIIQLPECICGKHVDVFYHFAWQGTSGAQRGDIDIQLKNVKAACDAVKACAQIGCKKFIYAASIMEYEINELMSKEVAPGINSIYSIAKITADYMSKTVANASEIEFIRVVISNIYGPGEYSPRLINTSIRKIIKKEYCSFSPGEQIYDFIYITDAAQAFYLLGEKGKKNKTYYLGSSHPRPLKEFLYEMRDAINKEVPIGIGDLPFNGSSLTYDEFDKNAIYLDTGFLPKVSFSEGVKNTARWIMEDES